LADVRPSWKEIGAFEIKEQGYKVTSIYEDTARIYGSRSLAEGRKAHRLVSAYPEHAYNLGVTMLQYGILYYWPLEPMESKAWRRWGIIS
jgi:hypothetical protein